MERYLADNPAAFFYHRPIYGDHTWVPTELELGISRPDAAWWIATFSNRGIQAPLERTELTSD